MRNGETIGERLFCKLHTLSSFQGLNAASGLENISRQAFRDALCEAFPFFVVVVAVVFPMPIN